ncbi:hypothetical protein HYC85_016361 [Camellia sinensis]|uniref:NADP-dependent oxidoreductase domain-containing protein n=1 Tax=Camellia sinensis TaxID=4442 RepID=A0A7J7GZE4_CAMSI|nr:hypothetical protein HYC85_016361 [Camellia sinensis]
MLQKILVVKDAVKKIIIRTLKLRFWGIVLQEILAKSFDEWKVFGPRDQGFSDLGKHLKSYRDAIHDVNKNRVSKLGYGCMGLTSMYNSVVPKEDGSAIIKYAFSKGFTFFDTSDIYGADNANEILVGKLPQEKIQLATKFGIVNLDHTQVVVNGSVQYVRTCCEASLKRLCVDYIDLYYVHRIDTSVPIEETVISPNTKRRAHVVHPITALQMEYSLLTRDIEEEIILICRLEIPTQLLLFIKIILKNTALMGASCFGSPFFSSTAHGFFGGKEVVETVPTNSFLVENIFQTKVLVTPPHYHPHLHLHLHLHLHRPTTTSNAITNIATSSTLVSRSQPEYRKTYFPKQMYLTSDCTFEGTTKIKNLDENIGAVRVKLIVPIFEATWPRMFEKDHHTTTAVVAIERSRRRLRDAQVREKTTKPDNFSSSMSHSTILSFGNRASNNSLFLAFPRDQGIAKKHTETRRGLAIKHAEDDKPVQRNGKGQGRTHVNLLSEMGIKKSILNIHLIKRPRTNSSDRDQRRLLTWRITICRKIKVIKSRRSSNRSRDNWWWGAL